MKQQKVSFMISLILATLCLTLAYGMQGQWIGVWSGLLAGFLWVYSQKSTAYWLPFFCLALSTGLAGVGILLNTPAWLMIVSSIFSLAVWDLILLGHRFNTSQQDEKSRYFVMVHIRSLSIVIGLGLMLTGLGQFIRLQLPFIWMVIIVLLTIFCLDQTWRLIEKSRFIEKYRDR